MKSMTHRSARAALLGSCLAALLALAQAQVLPPSARGEKRPPPPPTSTMGAGGIPTGQDIGTPATSKGADIGITTIPRNRDEMSGVKSESAAARAAARKRGPSIASVDAAAASGAASGVVTPPKLTAEGDVARAPKPAASSPARPPKPSQPAR